MEFGLLGPLLVRDGGRQVRLAPRQRGLLAALLLRDGRVVAAAELTELVWDGQPPAGERGALHTAVQRLRSALGVAGGGLIGTCAPGYVIELGDSELDTRRFAVLAESGRVAAKSGKWARAAADLHTALGLWRGEPLADVPSQLLRSREVPYLVEQRLSVLAARIDADLHLGSPEPLVAELRQLVTAYPLREGFHAQLMLALFRSGRQADALAAYQDARRLLADELGADPSAALRDLHQCILRGDSRLLVSSDEQSGGADSGLVAVVPAVVAPATPPSLGVPHQLPAAVRHFAGRTAELAVLTELTEEAANPGGTMVISAIDGTAGIGKTALAIHFAHQVADRFLDGQLYVNLRGFGPSATPVGPADAIRGFLDAFGVDQQRIPADVSAQAGLYRSLLAGKRVLLVLDNARDAGQVRPLLPGSPGCLVLVTSRSRLTPLVAAEDAHPLSLDVLPVNEARELLDRRLGAGPTGSEEASIDELIRLCARLPLALSIAAARAAARPDRSIAGAARELRDIRDRLSALDAGDAATSVRTVFSWSYDLLTQPAARIFRLLSFHPGPAASITAAASMAGIPVAQARQLMGELCRAHMITETAPDRYAFHDLLRAYATEQASTCDSAVEQQAATYRMLDYYLHTAYLAALLLNPVRSPLSLRPAEQGTTLENLTDAEQALAWFKAEYRAALAAVDRAAELGRNTHAWQIPWALSLFFDRRGQWREWAAIERTALAAAQRQGDLAGEADAQHRLGYASFRLGDYRAADAHLNLALEIYEKLGDEIERARVHTTMEIALELQGRYDEALRHAEQSLDLARLAGDRAYQAYPLNAIGWCHALLGDYQQTISHCQEALALHIEYGNHQGAADTWDSLGYAHHHLGRHAEAVDCYEHALGLYHQVGDLLSKAIALDHLGDTRRAMGNLRAAREAWERAVSVLDDLRHAKADEVRNKLRSSCRLYDGDFTSPA